MTVDEVLRLIWAARDVDRGAPRTHDDARDAADNAREFVKRKAAAIEFVQALFNDRQLLRAYGHQLRSCGLLSTHPKPGDCECGFCNIKRRALDLGQT